MFEWLCHLLVREDPNRLVDEYLDVLDCVRLGDHEGNILPHHSPNLDLNLMEVLRERKVKHSDSRNLEKWVDASFYMVFLQIIMLDKNHKLTSKNFGTSNVVIRGSLLASIFINFLYNICSFAYFLIQFCGFSILILDIYLYQSKLCYTTYSYNDRF